MDGKSPVLKEFNSGMVIRMGRTVAMTLLDDVAINVGPTTGMIRKKIIDSALMTHL